MKISENHNCATSVECQICVKFRCHFKILDQLNHFRWVSTRWNQTIYYSANGNRKAVQYEQTTIIPKNSSHALCFARAPHFARSFFRTHSLLRTLFFRTHSSLRTLFFSHSLFSRALLILHVLFFFACTLTSHALLSGAGAMVSFGSFSSERCLKCVQFCPQLLKFCNNPEPFLLPICAQSATESTIVKAHRF